MIAATRRWLRRNRNNILIGTGILGAGYLAGQYVLGKIQEARQRMSEEKIAKENLRRRFEQNQEDCAYTVLALLPTVRDEILGALPVEQITEQLQQERQERLKRLGASEAASSDFPSAPASTIDDDSRSLASSSYVHASQVAHSSLNVSETQASRPKRSKAQLWQDMKINSIARALTLIYTLCLLTILTRIQLNLLGRRTYLSSVVAMATPPAVAQSTISLENRDDDNYDNVYGNDFETNRKYLTFSWWLLHRGSKMIMERVIAAVKEVFSGVNIREDLSLERLADLIMQVRRRVEGETEEERRSMKWLVYLLPPKSEETFVIRQSGMSESDESPSPEAQNPDPMESAVEDDEELINESLRRLLDETADLVDSPTFSYVLTRLLDAGFSHLVDYRIATEAYKAPGPAAPGTQAPRIVEISDTKCKLAHVLPVFCKQAHIISAGNGELDTLDGVAAQEALGNEYLTAIDQTSDLGAFAAVIYSSNFEYEVPDFVGAAAAPKVPREDSSSLSSPELVAQVDAPAPVFPSNRLEQSEVLVLSGGPEESNEPVPVPARDVGPGRFETAWMKATTPAEEVVVEQTVPSPSEETHEQTAISSNEESQEETVATSIEVEDPQRKADPVLIEEAEQQQEADRVLVEEAEQQQKPKDEDVIKLT